MKPISREFEGKLCVDLTGLRSEPRDREYVRILWEREARKDLLRGKFLFVLNRGSVDPDFDGSEMGTVSKFTDTALTALESGNFFVAKRYLEMLWNYCTTRRQ
jgi:hypothetical protein